MTLFPSAFSRLACSALLVVASSQAFAADEHPAVKRKTSPPPSAELNYSIEAKQSGLSLKGEALVKWNNNGNSYSVVAETRAMLLGKILDSSSEGGIDSFGLAPNSFVEKRLRREASTTTFNRDAKTIGFSQSEQNYPLLGGEQDRTSITWQLIAVARANAAQFKNGSEWQFFVAGPRDAEQWTFKVVNREKIKTKMGELNTVHIFRAPPPDDQGQKLDIWLAPAQDWYPVRLRFTDPDGDFIEQTLDAVTKKKS